MVQPGSLGDSSVSFSKTEATAASFPTFAIQVTAKTTIVPPYGLQANVPADWENILGLGRCHRQFRNESVNEDGVVTIWTGRDHADFRVGFLLQKRQILPSLLRQLVEVGDAFRRSLPPSHLVIDTLNLLVAAGLSRHVHRFLSIDLVADANRNLCQFVKYIQLCDDQPRDAVNHASVAKEGEIHPTGTPRTSGYGTIFVTSCAQLLSRLALLLAGERAFAHTRAVSFGYPDHRVDSIRSNTCADGRASGSRAGGGHKGVGAVIDV